MDVFSSRPVAPGCKSLPTRPEINLRDTSLWGVGFGGLKRRFKDGYYKDVRLTDPWSGCALRFRTTFHADNWLLRAFDPDCITYSVANAPLRVFHRGELVVVKQLSIGQLSTGRRFIDFVVQKETARTRDAWTKLVLVADAHGLIAVKRGIADIWANLTLLQNLETMRSHLVMHVRCLHEAIAVASQIIACVGSASMPVGALAVALRSQGCCVPRTTVDFALFRAHRRGELILDIASAELDDRTTVAAGMGSVA